MWLTSAAANKYHSAWSLERVPHSHFFIYLKRMHSLEYISIEKEQNCQLRLVAYSPFLSLALWRAFPFCLVFPSKPCGQLLGSLHSLSRTEETVFFREREHEDTVDRIDTACLLLSISTRLNWVGLQNNLRRRVPAPHCSQISGALSFNYTLVV